MKIFHSKKTSVNAFSELDERFSFDYDEIGDSFSLDTTTSNAEIYFEDSAVIDGGAGVRYTVVIAVPRDADHWQMQEDIQRNLDRHVNEVVDGSDYCGSVVITDSHVHSYDVPDDVADNCVLYRATIDIIPYQNISPWGDYGIDYGTEEYFDHVTKGTPWTSRYDG